MLVFLPLHNLLKTAPEAAERPLNLTTTHLWQEALLAEKTLPNESLVQQAYDELDTAQYRIVACMSLLEKDPDDNPDAAKAVKLILWDVLGELNGLRSILPVVLQQPEPKT